ncbi:hypothetical protein D3C72_1412970 [compost metagenome]
MGHSCCSRSGWATCLVARLRGLRSRRPGEGKDGAKAGRTGKRHSTGVCRRGQILPRRRAVRRSDGPNQSKSARPGARALEERFHAGRPWPSCHGISRRWWTGHPAQTGSQALAGCPERPGPAGHGDGVRGASSPCRRGFRRGSACRRGWRRAGRSAWPGAAGRRWPQPWSGRRRRSCRQP